MGALKVPPSWQKRLAAETHPADGEFLQVAVNREEFLQVAVNREEFLKLLGRTRNLVTAKRDGLHFKPE